VKWDLLEVSERNGTENLDERAERCALALFSIEDGEREKVVESRGGGPCCDSTRRALGIGGLRTLIT